MGYHGQIKVFKLLIMSAGMHGLSWADKDVQVVNHKWRYAWAIMGR